jgi:putative DNA primase/helicase
MSAALEPAEMADLRARLVECAEDVALLCFGEPNIRNRSEWRWGKRNGSLAMAIRGAKRGLWRDRASNEGGDLLGMLRKTFGNFPEAIERALAITGYSPPSREADLTPEQRQRRKAVLEADRVQRAIESAARQARVAADRAAEDAAEIAKAQRVWSETVPLDGSLGLFYLTETRGIPEPPGGFCPDTRWHPGERAVTFAARSPTGIVTAVQIVRLDDRGRKRIGGSQRLVKKTIGRLTTEEGQSILRWPAWSDARPELLQHAEGPETGLSGYAATGVETWISFGSGVAPQLDRINVVLADDDAPDSDRAKGAGGPKSGLERRWHSGRSCNAMGNRAGRPNRL